MIVEAAVAHSAGTESSSESVVLIGGINHLSRSTSESLNIVFHRSFVIVYVLILLRQTDLFVHVKERK
uniref:RRM domain-containing protein n=1 Tax=Parascaris univalens TaxID=6257 RepID=A0A915AD70_PARUN